MAEPFRVLVVANFPVNFSDDAARRLVSIASAGPAAASTRWSSSIPSSRCRTASTSPIWKRPASILDWQEEQFRLAKTRTSATFPADPGEAAAAGSGCTEHPAPRSARRRGGPTASRCRSSRSRRRRDEWWTSDSRGRHRACRWAGPGRKACRYLDLGKGTSQHVLIAGKTGSGKSTLLHALITHLALLYSPDEVELYLIDFKKGVEFKTYASHRLPHARVVAIESEREFGLSVLQRLDAELSERGELFRNAGVNDLASYREYARARRCRSLASDVAAVPLHSADRR